MPGAVGTDSPSFNALNRGKRSVVLDLKTDEGRDAFIAAGALDRHPNRELSAGRDGRRSASATPTLSALNPGLIYASISGYGQSGPDRAQGRIRSDRAGRGRHHVDHRRARRSAGEGRRAADRPERGAVRAGRHPRGRRASASQRRRAARRRLARRRRRGAVGVGGDRSTSRARDPAGARLGAPDDRAVSGDPLRRRLHHARRRQRAPVPAPVRRARPSRVERTARVRRRRQPRAAPAARSPIASKRSRPRRRAATGSRCSTPTTSRAGRSTTTRRCSRIRRSSRARWWSRPSTRRSDGSRRSGSPIKMSATPPDVVTPRAAAWRTHRRSAARGGVQQRRDRRAPPIRRGAVTT